MGIAKQESNGLSILSTVIPTILAFNNIDGNKETISGTSTSYGNMALLLRHTLQQIYLKRLTCFQKIENDPSVLRLTPFLPT